MFAHIYPVHLYPKLSWKANLIRKFLTRLSLPSFIRQSSLLRTFSIRCFPQKRRLRSLENSFAALSASVKQIRCRALSFSNEIFSNLHTHPAKDLIRVSHSPFSRNPETSSSSEAVLKGLPSNWEPAVIACYCALPTWPWQSTWMWQLVSFFPFML